MKNTLINIGIIILAIILIFVGFDNLKRGTSTAAGLTILSGVGLIALVYTKSQNKQ